MDKTKELPQKLREEIISLHLKGIGYKKICQIFNIPRDAVRSIIRKFKFMAQLKTCLARGKKPNISSRALSNLIRMTKKNPHVTAKCLQDALYRSPSVATIRQALNKQGLHGQNPRCTPHLTTRNIKGQLEYAGGIG